MTFPLCKCVLAMSLLGTAACGADVERSGGAGGSGGVPGLGSGGAGVGGGAGNGVPDACLTPEGYQICGGPVPCPSSPPACELCVDLDLAEAGEVTLCINQAFATEVDSRICYYCTDGSLCVDNHGAGRFTCVPYSLGALFAEHGAGDRVRYADKGLWTGDPIPSPDTCPSFDHFEVCGGNCGGCPGTHLCTGRSPLHPFGICVPTASNGIAEWCDVDTPCPAGDGCFVFTVEPDAQALADQLALCVPIAACAEMASKLPGGGKCVTP